MESMSTNLEAADDLLPSLQQVIFVFFTILILFLSTDKLTKL